MVPSDDLANAVVLYGTSVSVSQVFGPALAGLIATTLGYGWCFTLDAASYLAVIASLLMMRPRELFRSPPAPRTGRAVREGFRYVLSVRDLWLSFAMFAAIGTFSFNFRVALSLFVTRSLHSTDVAFTALYVYLSAVAVFFVGGASIVYMTATTSLAQVDTRRDMVGRVLALQTALIGGTALVGGPIVGRLADLAGGRAPIAIGGVVCLIAAAMASFALPKRRL